MDRVFLDANVLFSAAYRVQSGLLPLWQLENVQLVTSAYAVEEARRNLPEVQQNGRLLALLRSVEVAGTHPAGEPRTNEILAGLDLPDKDRPILLAALDARATHLLTGDVTHFGRYFGKTIEGLRILRPAQYSEEWQS